MTESIFSATNNSSSPYRDPVTEILQLLEDAEIVNPDNKQKTIAIAQKYLEDNSDFISVNWHVDDVIEVADNRKLKLSKDQALQVLKSLKHNQDACYGISWETIQCTIDSTIDS